MILDKRVFVYRFAPAAGQETQALHPAWPSGVMMNIQPLGPTLTALTEGQLFKSYRAFTTVSGIVETYQLTVSGTTETYLVRGRERFDYGSGQHYELNLERGTR
jgi:hypothetical protein